jgi:hypothetical protein
MSKRTTEQAMAFELPEGWTEASPGGMATSRDPILGGIIDRTIVTGEWFAIPNRPGIGPLEGFKNRPAAFAALQQALAKAGSADQLSRSAAMSTCNSILSWRCHGCGNKLFFSVSADTMIEYACKHCGVQFTTFQNRSVRDEFRAAMKRAADKLSEHTK